MSSLLEKYLAVVKKLIPEQVSRPLVGLDIGGKECKMLELKKNGSSYTVASWALVPIENGDMAAAVKSCLSKATVPVVSPTTAIFGKGSLIRYIDMPKMSADDLKKSFAFEADKYFPFPKDSIHLDCHILSNIGKDNKMSVLAAAVKKDLVSDRIKMLTDLGLQADHLSLNSIGLANAFSVFGAEELPKEGDAQPKAVAVLDMSETLSNVMVFVGREPCFTRDIYIGGQDLSKGISSSLGVGLEEAEALKQDPKGRDEEVLQAYESAVLELISELRLSFDYFVTERNIALSGVLLTGEASVARGLLKMIANYLELDVKAWDPFKDLDCADGVNKESLSQKAPCLTVALGLALGS